MDARILEKYIDKIYSFAIGKTFTPDEADDLSHVVVSLYELPSDSKEGSVLLKKEDGSFILDNKEEKRRRKRILELQRKLQCKKRQ